MTTRMDLSGVRGVRLVLWRGAWHYAESSQGDQGVPLVTICGRDVPLNASVLPFDKREDVCGQCLSARPIWRHL